MFWDRLINLFRPRRLDRDIQRELEFHVAERADQLHAEGVPLDEARQTARRHFGNALRIREDTHRVNSVGWIELVTQEVRVSIRMFRKNPGFAAVAVATLGLGIGATTAVFSVLNGILIPLRPIPFYSQLYCVDHHQAYLTEHEQVVNYLSNLNFVKT